MKYISTRDNKKTYNFIDTLTPIQNEYLNSWKHGS